MIFSTHIKRCYNKKALLKYMNRIDTFFVPRLSERVNIDNYLEKALRNGYIYIVCRGLKIISVIVFYSNDKNTKKAFISLLATLPKFRKRGYGKMMLEKAEIIAKNDGMDKMIVTTDITNTTAKNFYVNYGFLECNNGIYNKITLEKEIK